MVESRSGENETTPRHQQVNVVPFGAITKTNNPVASGVVRHKRETVLTELLVQMYRLLVMPFLKVPHVGWTQYNLHRAKAHPRYVSGQSLAQRVEPMLVAGSPSLRIVVLV